MTRASGVRTARPARDWYDPERLLHRPDGSLPLAEPRTARQAAARMNHARALGEAPGPPIVAAGDLLAFGLIHEVFHEIVARYEADVRPNAMAAAAAALEGALGRRSAERLRRSFATAFPAPPPDEAPAATVEELLLTRLANENPAVAPIRDLVDDRALAEHPEYETAIGVVGRFFAAEPGFGAGEGSLVELLRAPAGHAPTSLAGQLRYIRDRWGPLLGDLLDRLLVGLDVIAEEERALHLRVGGGAGPGGFAGTAEGPDFAGLDVEHERFSTDSAWMPRVVLLAKSTYVWLDQLSRRYERDIRTLDAIPDEELDRLAAWGVTGLWLIGLWQRSAASQRIKRLRGNPDAVASAYALDDYRIADDLGGETAYAELRDRAWQRGIRLASDMVPNHMGIDSRWVVEHPEWFLSLAESPYPSYAFGGPDLSSDERVGIFLEDHYYDSSDAAVVFRRLDRWTGENRFVYHGNDGTSFPWNDTAQLDYLRPDVREAVIRTIVAVARRFPIIRFDAAMVLARKHIERLWYPEPGAGGAIPSRAEHGAMTKAEFDARMPVEFWREVVDRIAAEAPDTLLLAEAFWLLEGYFVRTLGMHRVYNSAFMHMLRDEDNAAYRRLVADTLAFDPAILQRYVNFMSNPDEKTAIEQFGKGDKYFGVATVLATIPGLPMLGHGQIEGFGEKYGMEFRRATLDERPDPWLVERHEREIFPLLHRRAAFAEATDFRLYDFEADGGGIDENVIAYSNGRGPTRSLVVYHNRFASTAGRLRRSAAIAVRDAAGGKRLVRRSLAQSLEVPDDDAFVCFTDARTGLEYIRPAAELRRDGLSLALDAYACHVFWRFRDVRDGVDGQWRRVAERLAGRGVPSLADEYTRVVLEPVHDPYRRLVAPELARRLGALRDTSDADREAVLVAAARAARALGDAIAGLVGPDEPRTPPAEFAAHFDAGLRAVADLGRSDRLPLDPVSAGFLLAWLASRDLDGGAAEPAAPRRTVGRFDAWRLADLLAPEFRALGLDEGAAWRAVDGVRATLALPPWPAEAGPTDEALAAIVAGWLADESARRAIGANVYEDVLWVERDAWDTFVERAVAVAAVREAEAANAAPPGRPTPDRAPAGERAVAIGERLKAAAREAGFGADRIVDAVHPGAGRPTSPGRRARRRRSDPEG